MRSGFPADRYDTPDGTRAAFLNRVIGRWRWGFYLEYLSIVLAASRLARRGLYDDAAWVASSLRVVRAIERHRGRFLIEGIDRLRGAAEDGPFVFVANHMSTLETQVLPALIAPFLPVTFVVKESLVRGAVFGPIMRSRDPIVVGRRSPREDLEGVLREGPRRLQRGVSIVVFPQSTRSAVFRRESFNTLGVKLAAGAGVPVFPVAIKTDFWGEEGTFRGFGPIRPERTIHIEFGEPLRVTGRGRDQHLAIVEFIESRLARWSAGGA